MDINDVIGSLKATVTLCDKEGIITYMNKAATEFFKNDGGAALIGTNVLDCHPEPSRSKLEKMMNEELENIYMIVKNDKRKFVYQVPVYDNGVYSGFVEMMFDLPAEIRELKRD